MKTAIQNMSAYYIKRKWYETYKKPHQIKQKSENTIFGILCPLICKHMSKIAKVNFNIYSVPRVVVYQFQIAKSYCKQTTVYHYYNDHTRNLYQYTITQILQSNINIEIVLFIVDGSNFNKIVNIVNQHIGRFSGKFNAIKVR